MSAQPALTLAEAARSLVAGNRRGALTTLRPADGHPYGSVTDYAPLADGDVLLLLSLLAEHRRFLEADDRASLLIAPGLGSGDMLALARVTLLGRCQPAAESAALRKAYLDCHPQAGVYVDFADFDFFRLQVTEVRYIAGFGRMGWLGGDDYRVAAADPLAAAAAGILAHMNTDHPASLRDYARGLLGLAWVEQAVMTGIDRYGFDLYCRGAAGRTGQQRLSFDQPVTNPGTVRHTLIELAERARRVLSEKRPE